MKDQIKSPFNYTNKEEPKGPKKVVLNHTIYLKRVAEEESDKIFINFLVIKPNGVEIEMKFIFDKEEKKIKTKRKNKQEEIKPKIERIIKKAPSGLNVFLNEETRNNAMELPKVVYDETKKWAIAIYRDKISAKVSQKKKQSESNESLFQQGILNFEE